MQLFLLTNILALTILFLTKTTQEPPALSLWDPEPFQACTFTPSTPIGSSFWTQGSHRLHVRSGRPGLNSLCGPAMFRDPLRFLQGAQVLNCKELTCYVYLLTLLHQMQEDAKLCWGHIISTGTKKDTLKPKTGVITFWKLAPWNLMSFVSI